MRARELASAREFDRAKSVLAISVMISGGEISYDQRIHDVSRITSSPLRSVRKPPPSSFRTEKITFRKWNFINTYAVKYLDGVEARGGERHTTYVALVCLSSGNFRTQR